VEFATLYPFDSTYLDPRIKTNDLSCVLRISGAGGSVLLTGDIEARAESAMLARDATLLRSNLLIVPHHGSRTSSPAFIAARVRPPVYTPGYRHRSDTGRNRRATRPPAFVAIAPITTGR
jgi:competence protein ComEC